MALHKHLMKHILDTQIDVCVYQRRICISKRVVTDYVYLDAINNDDLEMSELDFDNPIQENDWVIMSLPICW